MIRCVASHHVNVQRSLVLSHLKRATNLNFSPKLLQLQQLFSSKHTSQYHPPHSLQLILIPQLIHDSFPQESHSDEDTKSDFFE